MIIPNKEFATEEENKVWTRDYVMNIMDKVATGVQVNTSVKFTGDFSGKDLSDRLVKDGYAKDGAMAQRLGQAMYDYGILAHVTRDSVFKNDARLMFRFTHLEKSRGHPQDNQSWGGINPDMLNKEFSSHDLAKVFGNQTDLVAKNKGAHIPDMMFDQHNIKMYDNVRPRFWKDPERTDYDIIVIGGGAAGMVTSAATAMLGAKAAIIERGFIGGDCLVTGCVPSKAFLKSCHVAHYAKNGKDYGVLIEGEVKIDFAALMARMRAIRADISNGDAAERFANYYGAHIFMG